jgi:hypothetical protein
MSVVGIQFIMADKGNSSTGSDGTTEKTYYVDYKIRNKLGDFYFLYHFLIVLET